MNYIIISIILFLISGLLNALMDLSSEGNRLLKPKYHKTKSANNKWELNNGKLIPYTGSGLKYFFFKPKYKEKFLYSSTWFVWTTDFWHFVKMLYLISLKLCIVVITNLPLKESVILYFTLWFIYGLGFKLHHFLKVMR